MKVFGFLKSLVNGFIIKNLIKKSFTDAEDFAKGIDDCYRQYCELKIMNINKHLTRSPEGVLYLFNYDRYRYNDDFYQVYTKHAVCFSRKNKKFTAMGSDLDYEDYKKIIYYDDLYETYIREYLFWDIPDGIDTDDLFLEFHKKLDSYPSVKLKQILKY